MTALYFVDANILVYSRDPSEPVKFELARALLRRLWSESSGRTSIQALNEFYSVRTRKVRFRASEEEAWADVEELFEWNPLPPDTALLQAARQMQARYKLSWWDSLIVAAARAQGCSVLYTEDLQHGAVFDGVRVCNPFLSQIQEEPAPYRLEAVSPHRPRGRPRKRAA